MEKFTVRLWKTLQELKDDEFKKFKWLLKQDDISAAQLEKADRQDTVDLMSQKYGTTGAMKETMTVLEKISRHDLVQGLKNSCPDPKDLRPTDFSVPKEESERKKAELRDVQQRAADVTLDPNDIRRRFYRCVCWSGQSIDQQERTNHSES